MKQSETPNGKHDHPKACPNSPDGLHFMGSATLEWERSKYIIWMNCYYCGISVQSRSFTSQRDWKVSDCEKLVAGR